MKKCYKAPESIVIALDVEGIVCESMGVGTGTSGDEGGAAQIRESYRSSLWND